MDKLFSLLKELPLPKWVYQTIVVVAIIAIINYVVYPNFYFPQLIITWLLITLWAIALAGCIKAIFTKAYVSIVTSRHGKTKDVFPHRKKAFLGIGGLAFVTIVGFFIPQSRSYIFVGAGWQKLLVFEPAKPDQTMLIIAKFQDLSAGKAEGFDPEGYIERLITDKIGRDNPRFPVKRYNQTIISNSEQAKQLLKDYNAAIVTWGTYNAAGGRLAIEVAKESDWAETYKNDFRYSLSEPQSVELTFTKEIPEESSYAAFMILGGLFIDAKDYDNAVPILTQAISIFPTRKQAYNYRGISNFWKGIYDLALADYTKAIDLDPKDALAYDYRGITYDRQGKDDLAIADYTKAIDLEPKYTGAYNDRGIVYYRQGKGDLALADFTKAIDLEPKYGPAYNNRGSTYLKQGNYDLAIADFTKAIDLEPNVAVAYYNRGSVYEKQGKYDLALADFTKAIDLDAKDASAYNNRGTVYADQGKYDLAIADYTKAIDLGPKTGVFYSNRGNVYADQGKYDLAIADYTKAIDLDPKAAVGYSNRGTVYADQGKYDLAIADYTKAIDLEPKNAYAFCRLGIILSHRKNFTQAITSMEKGLQIDSSLTICKNALDQARLGTPAP